jgi:hypothetical protein
MVSGIPVRARLAMTGGREKTRARAVTARQRVRNWRTGKAWDRGRRDLAARAGDQVRSRVPVFRDRVNRGTGRPHRMDPQFGRGVDRTMARVRDARAADLRARPLDAVIRANAGGSGATAREIADRLQRARLTREQEHPARRQQGRSSR